MTPFKLWRRWDPRLGSSPLRTVLWTQRWVIEVVPDVFAPGHEVLRDEVVKTIATVQDSHTGRWLLRTAHPGEAVATLRWLHENDRGNWRRTGDKVPSRVVLAVYAETQAELDARVAELRAPRVMAERLALTDMDAAVALATKEGALYESPHLLAEVAAARGAGPEALAAFLKGRYQYHHRTSCLGPDTGGLALYLSPRERIDVTAALAPVEGRDRWRSSELGVDNRPFDWTVVAGPIGPFGEGDVGPWPVHPRWITDVAVAARAARVPFCVPHIGEWACYDGRWWEGDHTVSGGMSSSDALPCEAPSREVDYDPTWSWGERGWDHDNLSAKPSGAYMQAVGSQLAGRALVGRIFDEWPKGWVSR